MIQTPMNHRFSPIFIKIPDITGYFILLLNLHELIGAINFFTFAFKIPIMMKHLLFHSGLIFMFVFPFTSVKAQITITQADMPMTGTKVVMGLDTSGTFLPQSASPLAQTWNYSSLANSETYSYLFVAPSITPYYSAFHSSNVADSTVYGNGYTYFSSTPSYFSETGFAERLFDSVLAITFNPLFEQISLPATYGTIDGGVAKGDTTRSFHYLLYDSARGKVNIAYSDTVDAFGVMTTPYGMDTVIRQKHYDITTDSAFVRSISGTWSLYPGATSTTITHEYRWYTKGINYYFAVMLMNTANTRDSMVFWYNGNTVGIPEISHSAFTKVYPNPCTTQITFSCSSQQATQISVFDVTGRKLFAQEIKNGTLILNTSAYSKGMYFYRVSDVSGTILDRGKFIVQ